MFLKAPPIEPTPTPAPTPKAPFFDPTAGQSRGTALNKPGDPVFPDAFRIAGALAGDRVTIQSVDAVAPAAAAAPGSAAPGSAMPGSTTPGSTTPGSAAPGSTATASATPQAVLTLGAPDRVRLAGIVAPTTEPSLSLAKKTIADWTAGRDVDVDVDAKYPTDLNGVRVVHVFYKGRELGANGKPGPFAGQVLSLNRMLVRSGMAVVDLYSPTSFDTSQWLLDEAYARRHKLGFWKFGVAIQQRIPINLNAPAGRPGTARPGNGARSTVSILPNAAPLTATTQSTATQSTTTQTTTTQPGASAPQPGASAPQPGAVPARP